MGQHRGLIMGFVAAAALAARVFVKFGATEGEVDLATVGADMPAGVTTDIDRAAGDIVDVVTSGSTTVTAGATITYGARIRGGADGKAVAAGVGENFAGIALANAAAGDIFPVLLGSGQLNP